MSPVATDYTWEFEAMNLATSGHSLNLLCNGMNNTLHIQRYIDCIKEQEYSITLPITIEVIQNPVADFIHTTFTEG